MDATRRPILFVTFPESGLINSMLVLAEEPSRRGVEDLWFATDDNRRDEVAALKVGTPAPQDDDLSRWLDSALVLGLAAGSGAGS